MKARFRSDWYHLLRDEAIFESEFEHLIIQNADILGDDCVVVPFKETVRANGLDPKKADLALVDLSYRFWWVIEVELLNHSLGHHVLPQVQTLVEGRYNEKHVKAILRHSADLDEHRLSAMMLGEQPKVVVLANRIEDSWKASIENAGAHYAAINVLRSNKQRDIFILSGTLPKRAGKYLTEVVPASALPGMFKVRAPGALPHLPGTDFEMLFNGVTSGWTLLQTATDCFLASNDRRLPPRNFIIIETDNGCLELREEN